MNIDSALKLTILNWANRWYNNILEGVVENLTGGVLNVRSGKLLKTVLNQSKVSDDGFQISTGTSYGRAWEAGFTRKAFTITRNFKSTKGRAFSRSFKIPSKRFEARPWLGPVIDIMKKGMADDLEASVQRDVGKLLPKGRSFTIVARIG